MTPDIVARVPNQEKTPRRTIRINDDVWNAAAEKAERKGETVSDVVRRALINYIRRG